jgi:hypothetical protein
MIADTCQQSNMVLWNAQRIQKYGRNLFLIALFIINKGLYIRNSGEAGVYCHIQGGARL